MKRLLIVFSVLFPLLVCAQTDLPKVAPSALYITVDGEELTELTESQSAPLKAHFYANPTNVGNYSARYEWKAWREGDESDLLVHRFDEELDFTFAESGTFCVQLYATFILGNDTITYPTEDENTPIVISISQSKLEFPNAFSPNSDGYNDELQPLEGYQSIVSFQAAVFNRWGTKLYSWDNVAGKWDGKYNGKVVRDGVYFLVVHAKGADGRKFNIKQTISVLTHSRGEGSSSGGGTGENE